MKEQGLEALISVNPANIRYLTGFKGEPRTLLVTEDHFLLLTALRTLPWAQEQTKTISNGLEVSSTDEPVLEIRKRLPDRVMRVALDSSIAHHTLEAWRKHLSTCDLRPAPVIETIRQIKSESEISLLEQSQRLNESVFAAVLPQIRPDMTERGVQGLILAEMARNGRIEGWSFPPIVAAGGNCWEIHHLPDQTVIGEHQMLLIDLGVMYQGYASDMTRTVCLGKSSTRMREIHRLVGEALDKAIASTRKGRTNREIDAIARETIDEAGFGHTFTHGLGHQIGLETHDPAPPLSPKAREIILQSGMAFTIEPGVYLQHEFGVRTEDVVVVTDGVTRNLTRPSHQLLELEL